MSNILDRRCVRGSLVAVDNLFGTAFTGEEDAHTFRVTVYEGNTAVPLTGTVAGKFISPTGTTVPLSGSLDEDGRALVTLDEHCYVVGGRFILTIWSGAEVIYCGVGWIMDSETEVIAYPTAAIPDVAALIQQLQTILNNWPADYSQLQSDVSDLKSATDQYAIDIRSVSNSLNTEILTRQTQYTGLNSGLSAEINRATNAENAKLNKPSTNGTNGQCLISNGDGSTSWQNPATPSSADVSAAVTAWLNDHPDATTTVTDDSITIAKLSSSNKLAVKRALSAGSILFPEKIGSYFSGMIQDMDGKTIRNMQACVFLSPSVAVVAFDGNAETSEADKTGYRRLQRVSMLNGSVLTSASVDIGHGNSLAYNGDNTVAVACYSSSDADSEYVVKTFNATTLEAIETYDLETLVSPYFDTYTSASAKHIVSVAYHQSTGTWIVMGGGYLHDGGRICVELSNDFTSVVSNYTLSADVGKIEAAQDMTCDNDYIYVMCGRYDTYAVFDMASHAFVGAFKMPNYFNDEMYIGETESITIIDNTVYFNARVRPNNTDGRLFGIVNSFGKVNLWGSFGDNADWNATKRSRATETRVVWVNSSAASDTTHYMDTVNFFTATGAYSKPFATIYEALCIRHNNTLQINLLSDITTPVYIVNDDIYLAGRKNNYTHSDESDEDDPGTGDESSDLVSEYINIAGLYAKDSNIRVSGCVLNGTVTKGSNTAYLYLEHTIANLGSCPDITPISGDTTNGLILSAASELRWTLLTSAPKVIENTCAYFANGIDVKTYASGRTQTDSEGKITVTFAVPLRSIPAVVCNASGSSAENLISVKIITMSSTGFTAIATNWNGTSVSVAASNYISWVAVAR